MYDAEERETYITTDDTRDDWTIFTRSKSMIRKLEKLKYTPVKVELENREVIGAEYVISNNKISIRNANYVGRQFTDEQRKEAAERLKKNKEAR